MKNSFLSVMGICVAAALTLTSCVGGGETESKAEASDKVNVLSFSSTVFNAYVDSVDGNTLNLTLGAVNGFGGGQGDAPDMPNDMSIPDMPSDGSAPDMPSDMSMPDMPSDGSAPDMPSDMSMPDMPSDGAFPETPSSGKGGEMFIKGDTAAVLVIYDASVICTEADGETSQAALTDITAGSVIEISVDENSKVTSIKILDVQAFSSGEASGGNVDGGDGGSTSVDYSSANTYTSDTTVSGTLSSAGTDENAALVNGASVIFDSVAINRVSSDSTGGDNSSFYGVGAALLVIDGTAYVKDGSVSTDASGGAGVFAYGDGTVYIAGADISTVKGTSGGIHVAGGGTLYAWDLTVTTAGESSAAIRSDRGSGTMVVDGGSYTSNGTGSPAIYSTADITVNNATLTANGSEAICIEGKNNIRLFGCSLTGNMKDSSVNDTTWTVILNQSMSGDSVTGTSEFEMVGGSLASKNGGLFYTTNTSSRFLLSGVDITSSDGCEFFLQCTGNANQRGWGGSGSNGADCTFTATGQTADGDVIWDSISKLDFYLTSGSTLTGAVRDDESCAGNGGSGYCNLYISSDSAWIVTGDSTLTSLYCAGAVKDASGASVTVKGTDGTVYINGTSQYTVTVASYGDTADLSGADTASSFSDYEVSIPDRIK